MKPRFLLAMGLAALLWVVSAPTVQAGLTAKSVLNSGGGSVKIHFPTSPLANGSGNISTTANSFTTTVLDGSKTSTYETYCVDLYHYINSSYVNLKEFATNTFATNNSANYTGSPNTPNTTYGQAGLGRAAWLVNTFANQAGVNKIALQIAVWKAEYETDLTKYDSLSAGAISFTGLSSAVLTAAKSYLDQSWAAGGSKFASDSAYIWFSFNKSGHYTQDQITAVPEPTTLAIAGLGTLAFVGYGRFRRRRDA